MTSNMEGLVKVCAVLLLAVEIRCLPAGIPAEYRGEMAMILHADIDAAVVDADMVDELVDREERAVEGSADLPPGMGDDEDMGPNKPLLRKPEVMKLVVESRVTARFASTEVRSKLKNINRDAAEAEFSLRLPEDAFISAFSMTIDDVVYHSEVKEKRKAQKAYNEAKAKGQTAGQVKQSSPEESKFTVSVTVAGRTSVIFNVTYEQLLKRKNGEFEHRISIQPGQVVPDVRVLVQVSEPQGLKVVNASWELADKADQAKLNNMTQIESKTRAARVLFDSRGEGVLTSPNGIMGEFVVTYDVMHDLKAGHIEIMNGYFVHYFSPVDLPVTSKHVVFVIDTSGSMRGRKMAQTKVAFDTILDDVRPIDKFNIVLFESRVSVWRENQMVTASRNNIEQAKQYVNRASANGGTNIYEALMSAISLLTDHGGDNGLPMIIMLTDGQPTSGPYIDTGDIISRITAKVEDRLSLFSVGFGNGVDYNFLEKLSLSNQALARKVYEDSSASIQMKGFYDEVANPLLFNLNLDYNNNVDKDSLTKSSFMAYFDGTEITVAGKLQDEVINNIWTSPDSAVGNGDGLAGSQAQSGRLASAQRPDSLTIVDGNNANNDLELEVVITAKSLDVDLQFNTSTTIEERPLRRNEIDDFVQRLWAYLTIKNLLDQRKTATDRQMKDALSERALNLSLKYHFVTPLTSLLVIKPENDRSVVEAQADEGLLNSEAADAPVLKASSSSYNRRLSSRVYDMFAFYPPASMLDPVRHSTFASADSDPHFTIEIPDTGVSVCFDINGKPGDIFNLLHDPLMDLSVAAYVIPTKSRDDATFGNQTYFGRIGIRLGKNNFLTLTTTAVVINDGGFSLRWDEKLAMRMGDFVVTLDGRRHVVINRGDDVVVVAMLHRVGGRSGQAAAASHRVDHLGFYVQEGKGLSGRVHGLIGQFHQSKDVLVTVPSDIDQPTTASNTTATLYIDDRSVQVTRKTRRIPLTKDYRECWHAANNAQGLIEGDYADYILPKLNSIPILLN